MKRIALIVIVGLFACTTSFSILLNTVHTSAFTSSNLMDDSVFDNTSSMTADQIDAFLNSQPGSCISMNHGFSAPDPTGYSPSGGFTYGGATTAGHVIYDAANAYNMNPQVILATLQKEQSLTSGGGGCTVLGYTGAMGYGCPDSGTTHSYPGEGGLAAPLYFINGSAVNSVSGTCVNSAAKAGFSQQVIHGAWLLKFGEQRSEGHTNWAIVNGNWNNSDDPSTSYSGPMTQGTYKRNNSDASATFFDGYITIDGVATHMDSGPTAALYWYTPHFHGNQNFDDIFSNWFGSLYGSAIGPTAYRLYSQKMRLHFYTAKQNERFYAKMQGYNDDGLAFNVSSTQQAGMIPIYSLYSGGITDHWLIPDGPLRYWGLNFGGYKDDGIAFYAYPANATGSSSICSQGNAVYQLWHGGATEHFYSSINLDRYWAVIFGGYIDDNSGTFKDGNNGSISFCTP